ncbi:MAG: YdcF family protein [Hominimerdicola sp.]
MTAKHIIVALETILLFLFLMPFPIFNAGNILGISISAILLIITCNWQKFIGVISDIWSYGIGKAALIFSAVLIIAGLVYVTYLSVVMYEAQENEPEGEPNVIIVLGCKVRGERPTRMLRRRLDTAYEALQKYPDVLCIVSGGQGSDEILSEAEAMKNYLVEKGISADRIIMEDKSTSTSENLKYSFEILDELGISRDITIVTDGFHQYRAGLIAQKEGAGEITAYSAHTEPRYLFTYWVREWLGISRIYIIGK